MLPGVNLPFLLSMRHFLHAVVWGSNTYIASSYGQTATTIATNGSLYYGIRQCRRFLPATEAATRITPGHELPRQRSFRRRRWLSRTTNQQCGISTEETRIEEGFMGENVSLATTTPKSYLIVGDGDLSYSAMMAETMDPTRVRLTATVLEDCETHRAIYANSQSNVERITKSTEERQRHSVIFGVDATKLQEYFPSPDHTFHRIVFNFPHWKGKANHRYNRQLIAEFLQSASHVLTDDGEIHMALVHGQGGAEASTIHEWRQSWQVAEHAAHCGLLLKRLDPFQADYNRSSRRGTDRSFHVGDCPSIYVLGFPDGEAVPSSLALAFRHELRIPLENVPISKRLELLTERTVIDELIVEISMQFPGIRTEIPARDVVVTKPRNLPVLVHLIVYVGEAAPLSRTKADQIRRTLETAVIDQLRLPLVKANRMVSKSFPRNVLTRYWNNDISHLNKR